MKDDEKVLRELKDIKVLLREIARKVIKGEEVPALTNELIDKPLKKERKTQVFNFGKLAEEDRKKFDL